MIDQLLQADEKLGKTTFIITEENVFVDQDGFNASGLIENIAQTAAAQAGYYYRSIGQDVPIGYLAEVKNIDIAQFPKVGDKIETKIELKTKVFNINLVEASVSLNQKIICSCTMKLFIKEEE